MKKLVLVSLIAFSGMASAVPAESVRSTVDRLLTILQEPNQQSKVSQLCALVKSDVDNSAIGGVLLGNYSASDDAEGIKNFKAAVPSIIMDQFYSLLANKGGAEFTIGGTVPKGKDKVGVIVVVEGFKLVVTVNKSDDKVLDVELGTMSLVNIKRDEMQRELDAYAQANPKPVSALVDKLDRDGINKCR